MVEHKAWQLLDLSQTWKLSWYTLESSPRPIMSMDPGTISVLPLHVDTVADAVWPPPPRAPRRRAVRPHDTVPAAQAPAGEVLGPSEEISDEEESDMGDEAEVDAEAEELREADDRQDVLLARLLEAPSFLALDATLATDAVVARPPPPPAGDAEAQAPPPPEEREVPAQSVAAGPPEANVDEPPAPPAASPARRGLWRPCVARWALLMPP